MKKILVIAMVLAVSGCSFFTKSPTGVDTVLMQSITEAAVAQMLYDHPAWKQATINISSAAISSIDSSKVTDLASVTSYVTAMIPTGNLLPQEQVLVNVLIQTIVQNIQANLTEQHITNPAAQLVQVRQVLVWINQAAGGTMLAKEGE